MTKLEKDIAKKIFDYEHPKRIALSKKYPKFKKPIIFLRHNLRSAQNLLNIKISKTRENVYFSNVIARHQSVLRRELGDSDPRLQEQKIVNLKQAIKLLDKTVIRPNKIFSFWHVVGKPEYKKGYVDGMLLSNGKVIEGLGGGLCQLSNFLYWIFLHAPVRIVERYHHSMDVFPDSGRTLPFGSGATIFYNTIDLKIKNISPYPLQIKIWITDKYLKGQILSTHTIKEKFHVYEENHLFIKKGGQYFRYNELYREILVNGKRIKEEKIMTNFAPVLYDVTDDYLKKNDYKTLDFTKKNAKRPHRL